MSVMVPTVERGFWLTDFCSIEITGDRPWMKSTSGFFSFATCLRLNADIESRKRRCPSA